MANETKIGYAASATVAISLAADLTNGSNTYTGLTGLTMTELDNSVLGYPLATATLDSPDGFAVAPTDNTSIDLYMVKNDTDGTDDDTPVPASGDLQGAEPIGSFLVSNQTASTRYRKTINISLLGVKKANFFIVNNSGQTLDYVATPITLKILPMTFAPT